MKSFFIRRERDLVSAVKKDAWTVWFGHGLTETEHKWLVCEHEACMQAAVGFKERNPGGKELNKREPYLKMCLPGDAGEGMGLQGRRGTGTSGCQISTPRAGQGGFGWLVAGLSGLIPCTRVPMPLTTPCSADP